MRATHRIVMGPVVSTLAALALCAAGGANAAVIYDNGVAAVSVASQSDFDPQRFTADNFVLQPGATTITDVHWRGVYGVNGGANTPGTDAFTIQFYADAGGVPAVSPFNSYSVGSAVNRTDTLLDLGSGLFAVDIYSYSAVIAPLALTAGTTYWLSIVNDTRTDIDDNWAWGAALGGDGFATLVPSFSNAWIPSGVQFSRTLDFQLTNDVPEPGTLALLGLGFAALASTRRRMRSV